MSGMSSELIREKFPFKVGSKKVAHLNQNAVVGLENAVVIKLKATFYKVQPAEVLLEMVLDLDGDRNESVTSWQLLRAKCFSVGLERFEKIDELAD